MGDLHLTTEFYAMTIISMILLALVECDKDFKAERVNRRTLGDIIMYKKEGRLGHIACDKDNSTYLVEENQCLRNDVFFNGK